MLIKFNLISKVFNLYKVGFMIVGYIIYLLMMFYDDVKIIEVRIMLNLRGVESDVWILKIIFDFIF